MTRLQLTREHLVEALGELIVELQKRGETGELRIVGGAALALTYFERDVTQDIDLLNMRRGTKEALLDAALVVAENLNLARNWLNFAVANIDALPTVGHEVEWIKIFESRGISLLVPSAQALLAMKLRANRPGRDVGDIRKLLSLCGIRTVEEAEALYEAFYPGDVLPDRARQILISIVRETPAEKPEPPPRPHFASIDKV